MNVKKIVKILLFSIVTILFIIFLYPRRKVIYSPIGDGKCITVLDAFPRGWFGGSVFIIPGNHKSLFPPKDNYVSLRPQHEQVLYINWSPNDGHVLKIGLPVCNQAYKNTLDTSRYLLAVLCNTIIDGYLDKGEEYHYPKYMGYVDWCQF
jgi:hypothetical protein